METYRIMKRFFALVLLGLASAGCTQTSGAIMRGASDPPSPLALRPAPTGMNVVTQSRSDSGLANVAVSDGSGSEMSVPLVAQVSK
jgi:hypothetical protein